MTIAALAAAALPAAAQTAGQWPERPVRMIVPLGAGGPADLVGRYIAQQLGERFKQSFFIENRPGAAGIIGTAEAAKAAPDGYTLLVVASPHVNLEILSTNKPYVLMRDFSPVAMTFSTDAVLVVHPAVPATSVTELVALAKAKPGALTYASSGPGSNKHLGGELFKLMSGTDILHVAYKGSTGARNDIIGGHVHMMFDEVPSVAPNVIAGQVRALGVTGAKRSSALPDVPTVSEAGVPGYEHTGWFGVMAPAGTPKPVVDLLNAEIRAMLARADVKAYWAKQDTETMSMTPAQTDAFLRAEIEKWTKVVKAANIKLE
ncbi:MAG: tripartite tricarboxylate transporter substrate binding protein [Xanthobacteraceae bacterium]|nr:tripartite tricarboxylate transporter substrate binding protein [Xanthobacteraceae bacterium]